jgi:hypothetical protein
MVTHTFENASRLTYKIKRMYQYSNLTQALMRILLLNRLVSIQSVADLEIIKRNYNVIIYITLEL